MIVSIWIRLNRQTNGGGQYIGPGSTTYNRFNTGSGSSDALSWGATIGGAYAGARELSLVSSGAWKGANGKWNSWSCIRMSLMAFLCTRRVLLKANWGRLEYVEVM